MSIRKAKSQGSETPSFVGPGVWARSKGCGCGEPVLAAAFPGVCCSLFRSAQAAGTGELRRGLQRQSCIPLPFPRLKSKVEEPTGWFPVRGSQRVPSCCVPMAFPYCFSPTSEATVPWD